MKKKFYLFIFFVMLISSVLMYKVDENRGVICRDEIWGNVRKILKEENKQMGSEEENSEDEISEEESEDERDEEKIYYEEFSETGINSWWIYPVSVCNAEYSYSSYTDNNYTSGLIIRNEKRKTFYKVGLKRNKRIDDHNAGAVEVLPGGKILYAICSHNEDRYVSVFTSTDKTGRKWNDEQKLSVNGRTSYVQIIRIGDEYYLFTRIYNKGKQVRWSWAVTHSKDGENWEPFTEVISSGAVQYYLKVCRVKNDSKRIRLVMYSNPNEHKTDIRVATYNVVNNTVEYTNGKKKTVKKVDKRPVNFSFIPIYLKREKGTDYRLLDVAVTDLKTVKFLYAKYCKNNKDAHYYVYTKAGKKKESKIKIVNAGAVMYKKGRYIGGAVFDEKSSYIVYLSRYDKKTKGWKINKYKVGMKSSKMISNISQTKSYKQKLLRPFFVHNSFKSQIGWSAGLYAENSYKVFNTTLKKTVVK